MAPPKGSIFDPAVKWEEEKEARRLTEKAEADLASAAAEAEKSSKKGKKDKKLSTAETIKLGNAADKEKKDHERDLMKLGNLRTLKALQDATCETTSGMINRMLKMLHIAVSDLKQGAVTASEAEVLDILWALEEMEAFASSEKELAKDKSAKKDAKEAEKAEKKSAKKDAKKSSKKDKKKESKDSKTVKAVVEKVVLSTEAKSLKSILKEGGDARGNFKDSLKYARKILNGKENIISFQLTEMSDRLPPLSRYNRKFKLEEWQCSILDAIDNRRSAVVCAPTSSGKTLLSTYTCKLARGTVLSSFPAKCLSGKSPPRIMSSSGATLPSVLTRSPSRR